MKKPILIAEGLVGPDLRGLRKSKNGFLCSGTCVVASVGEGAGLHTDAWAGYNGIESLGL
ncbi:MAG: hypothetical protein ACRESZ_12040 [Methylococcales bacterium]